MVGGDDELVERAMPIFDALRPEGPREEGFVHAGAVGAGHYAKMVHNGIEYGLMQAYAEGYELLAAKDIVTDVHGCFQAWTRGTVVRSWLLDLLVKALEEDPGLQRRSAATPPTPARAAGPSRRPSPTRVPMPVISAALFARFASRQDDSPGDEGRRRAAQPVRRARRHEGGADVRRRRGRHRATGAPEPARRAVHRLDAVTPRSPSMTRKASDRPCTSPTCRVTDFRSYAERRSCR